MDHLHGTNLEQLWIADDSAGYIRVMIQLLMYQCYDLGVLFQFDGYEIMKIILSVDQPYTWTELVVRYLNNLKID